MKEKAREDKSLDQIAELLGKEGIEIPEELLGGVAGGFSQERIDSLVQSMRRQGLPEDSIIAVLRRLRQLP